MAVGRTPLSSRYVAPPVDASITPTLQPPFKIALLGDETTKFMPAHDFGGTPSPPPSRLRRFASLSLHVKVTIMLLLLTTRSGNLFF